MTTPHKVGQVSAAEIHIAHILDTAPAGTDTTTQAAVIVRELLERGWRPPHDPNDVPPLRPSRMASDAHREACMAEIDAALNRRKAGTSTP